jgi:predicted RNase H-like nuclease (RuvC/YqgF family)
LMTEATARAKAEPTAEDLRAEIEELKRLVSEQKQRIAELQRALGRALFR